MKKLLLILFVASSLNGFGQIVRTLNNVSNTADSLKPVSNAMQASLTLKANLASPTFTGTVSGVTSAMVGLSNVNNTSDANKPISSAETSALGLKQNSLSGTGLVRLTAGTISYDVSTFLTSITTGNVTTALGFTPYNATNPSGFISGISSANVTTALGFTPYNATNPSAYISLTGLSSTATGLTYTNTTGALSLTAGYVIPTSTQLATYLLSTTALSTYAPIASPVHTGDIETTTISSGVIVKSPNGTRFRLSVSNTGDIIATSL